MEQLTMDEMIAIEGGHHGLVYEFGHAVGDFVRGFLDAF